LRTTSLRTLTLSGLLGAIPIVLGITNLGFIPVPTAAGSATIMHLPAIIGGVAGGPIVGLFVGLIFGLFSLFRATTPLFADPLIAVLPRLFIGLVAFWSYRGLSRWGLVPGLIGAAVLGTLANTVGVLGMAVVRGYLAAGAAVSIGLLHGLPEVIVAALITVPVCIALQRAGLMRGAPKPDGAI
jgi:uncharacterized membrane protein